MTELPQSSEPIFLALARIIANGILAGAYPPGSQVPSTTELAAFFKINPITAGHALSELSDQGIVEKRRGIGTFVTDDALRKLRSERIGELAASYVDPLIEESRLLEISIADVIAMIRERDAATPQRRPTNPIHPIQEEHQHDE